MTNETRSSTQSLTTAEKSLLDLILTSDTAIWLPVLDPPGPQLDAYLSEADELFYGGSAGGGKMLAVDAVIWTPFGPKHHADIRIGDQVCNPDGTIARVINLKPYFNVPLYRVKFIDGASVLAGGDHNWLVRLSGKRYKAHRKYFTTKHNAFDTSIVQARIATTGALKDWVEKAQRNAAEGRRPYWPQVPLTQPVTLTISYRYPNGVWVIDPYVLGLLLGDGCFTNYIRLTTADPTIDLSLRKEAARFGASISRDDREDNAAWDLRVTSNEGLKGALRKLGLYGHGASSKFVPESYKRAPVEIRRAVLQGLMDTDGTVDSRGHCSFCSTSKSLAQDVQWLAWSLGYKATLFEKEPFYLDKDGERAYCNTAYRVYIQGRNTADLFRLTRKKSRCGPYNGGEAGPMRRVVGVEEECVGDAVCVTVDHPNGLYLTDDFIVTHNSDLLLGLSITAHRRSIIFRREFAQLSGASGLIERSRDLLQSIAQFNGHEKTWRKLPGDRTLEFGAVQYEKDKHKFQGRPHDFIGFDEVSEFLESQYRFLIGWLRTTIPDQRCRVVAAGNPPTHAEGEWVIKHWGPWLDDQYPHPAEPGELRWFAVLDGEDKEVEGPEPFDYKSELILPKSRSFIPARLKDNPYLRETSYETILQNLPEPLRSQLLYGDFSMGREDSVWQVIPTEWVRLAQERWLEEQPEVLTAIGVDVARGGKSQTVLSRRYGNWFAELEKHPGAETPNGQAVAGLVVNHLLVDKELLPVQVNIDIIGIGSSGYDMLIEQDIDVIGVNFSEGTKVTDRSGKFRLRNRRAELYWQMREDLDPEHGSELALPPDNELLADLVAQRWKLTPGGIIMKSKEDIKERIGRSPDCGDAVVLANWCARGVFFA